MDDAHQVEPHNVRVPRFRWERFGTRVDAMPGVSRTGVLNQFIAWYNREPNAHLPVRPGKD